jgi:hypothetical protein
MDYTTLAVATVITAVGGAEAKRITDKQPLTVSPVLGGFTLGIFLFAFGMVNETLATKFSVLIIIASLLINGKPLFTLLGGTTTPPSPRTIPTPITH